jgi:hypothetical protein
VSVYSRDIVLLQSTDPVSHVTCRILHLLSSASKLLIATFGAFPQLQPCEIFASDAAAGVFSDEECPFAKKDFIEVCCDPTAPYGIVCPICRDGKELINP